jgi:nucleotide-binding universal stress UspA family protein
MEQKILVVGADFSDTGDQAIQVGLQQLASGVANAMYVVHVLAMDDRTLRPEEGGANPDAHTLPMVVDSLAHRVAVIAQRERLPYHQELVRAEVRTGDVRTALLAAARQHHADLIIVGTHGRQGLNRLVSGSVAETLVRMAECSVLIARPERRAPRRAEREPDPRVEADTRSQLGARVKGVDEESGLGELPWRPTEQPASLRES